MDDLDSQSRSRFTRKASQSSDRVFHEGMSTASWNDSRSKSAGGSLSAVKLRLLEQRIRGGGTQGKTNVTPRPPGARIPLSAEQRRVWLHTLEQPDVPIYNELVTLHKYGSFDLAILEESFNRILECHEAWRTTFSSEGEQLVLEPTRISIPLIDLSALPSSVREAEALRIATEDAQTPIPIEAAPLFRAKVVRMSPEEHRFFLTFHHIVFDGISAIRIFVPQLASMYASLAAGKPLLLPTPKIQYGDYAIWREREDESAEVQSHLAWWMEQLAGELPTLRLPEDSPRPALSNHHGSMERVRLPRELSESLRELGRRHGATLYMTLMAAFNTLLFRYTGQDDFLIGSAADARRQPELENVIGCFLDTFVLRTKLSADSQFSAYLDQVKESVLRSLVAADVPFDRLVKQVNPVRDAGRSPLFQVFFTMRPSGAALENGWSIVWSHVNLDASKFDLHLEVGESEDEIDARFFYRTDIWQRATIRRMAAHWLQLLRSITQNPSQTLSSLDMLTGEEKQQILAPGGWNDTAQAVPEKPFHVLFDEQARRTPDAIAAKSPNGRWTYRHLNARAQQLALQLEELGIKPGSVVAIVLDRSLEMLAALLAVHKAGAAYLPIDIQAPPNQISACFGDAKPSAILTQQSLSHLTSGSQIPTLWIDAEGSTARDAAPRQTRDGSSHRLDDPAYLIYTSGTTGKPKGVEISHRSLVNLLHSMRQRPGFRAEEVFLAVTSISFDIAALELFLPLLCGGTVVIASRKQVQDPYLLIDLIERSHCTVMQATPALWRTLVRAGWNHAEVKSAFRRARPLKVLCGGESLTGELAEALLAAGAELWNMYGPTETTIWSLIDSVTPHEVSSKKPVSVGHPIANTKAYILDKQNQLLPVGVPGTLFIGGTGLAVGYRNNPAETAKRFITTRETSAERIYNTGDIAVRREDGRIEILGRTDNQVKIRGHRIEIEAIEAAMMGHEEVAAAAVRTWPESTGDLRLSAYIVSRDPSHVPDPAEIRRFLANDLPGYMIPSDFVSLSAIPLTPHGKIDRSRLPSPDLSPTPSANQDFESPEETQLAAIWSELLGTKKIGPNDSFFDLGGHSVLVAALQQRIKNQFGQVVSLAELFHSVTIRQQAKLARKSDPIGSALPPGVFCAEPGGDRKGLFWVTYINADAAKKFRNDRPLFCVTLTSQDLAQLGEAPALEKIAELHVAKILATQPTGPYFIGGYCFGGVLGYEIAMQLTALGHQVPLLIMVDAPSPSFFSRRPTLAEKLGQFRYYFARSRRLGLVKTYTSLRDRIKNALQRVGLRQPMEDITLATNLIESAAIAYRPKRYAGEEVLLVLAAERPPHANFLPDWQAMVPHDLNVRIFDSHHRDLLSGHTLTEVADAIAFHLAEVT
jgi:amino acid adenylation domain-containing protein